MTQLSLFGPDGSDPDPKPASDQVNRLRLLVTVKAAPNPSERYGETVCVAGLSLDLHRRGWIRLYPINFRELTDEGRFRKYDIVSVAAKPARQDQRRESWKPILHSLTNEGHLAPWKHRRKWLDPHVEESMCRLNRSSRDDPSAQSLALVRVMDVSGLILEPHPGWTPEEQRKINLYVNQLDLFASHDRTPLEAPRFRCAYRYRCCDPTCRGHRQGVLDWELVALQRRLGRSDAEALNNRQAS
ncbi:hypothetical protein [Plantactinospora sp. GCM10030261]|uniref:hypothetical protein n=1 Tax=Plantactinospora sp. GCM10030261 TaxID=3273420 RepID=UPI003618C1E5